MVMFILWHTRAEINAIKKYGGRYLLQNGFDGIVNGRPVEVRAIRDKKETRFRLQRNVHNDLLRGGGSYIFIDARNGRKKYRRVSARVDVF